jgi:LPPG:FO 2-phospho-L-lactate transferase
MADACLTALGIETSAAAVAGLYRGLIDGWLVADSDAQQDPRAGVTAAEVRVVARPLLMSDAETTRALARAAFALALELRGVA